ncbi:MAG: hypothetical protein LUH10_16785 [Tannerellaceae bacterium]|nr:hypothetical protein [Tannerellaceae bacterium]
MKLNLTKWFALSLMALAGLSVSCQKETDFVKEEPQPEGEVVSSALLEVPFEYLEIPDDVTDITTVDILQPGEEYVILGNFNGNIPHNGNEGEKIVVYVLGTWDVQNWNLESGIDVVVVAGGRLISSANSSLTVNGNSNIYILEGGSANFTNDFLYFSNDGNLYVAGTLNATFLQMNSGDFYIAPTGYASIGQLVHQGTGSLENDGTLIVAEDGWDEGESDLPIYEYNVTYIPGVDLYVVDTENPTELQYNVEDNGGFGAHLNTEDFSSIRLYLPIGTFIRVEDLPLTLYFNVGVDAVTTAIVKVTLN